MKILLVAVGLICAQGTHLVENPAHCEADNPANAVCSIDNETWFPARQKLCHIEDAPRRIEYFPLWLLSRPPVETRE
jgi:hypothetical protein